MSDDGYDFMEAEEDRERRLRATVDEQLRETVEQRDRVRKEYLDLSGQVRRLRAVKRSMSIQVAAMEAVIQRRRADLDALTQENYLNLRNRVTELERMRKTLLEIQDMINVLDDRADD